jgi:cell wall-associated NlpC family hydrolase
VLSVAGGTLSSRKKSAAASKAKGAKDAEGSCVNNAATPAKHERGGAGNVVSSSSPTKLDRVKTRAKSTAIGVAIGAIDEAEELEGIGQGVNDVRSAKRIYKLAKSAKAKHAAKQAAKKSSKAATAASEKGSVAGKSTTGATSSMEFASTGATQSASLATATGSAATSTTTATGTLASAIASAAAPIGGVMAGVLAFLLATLMASQLMGAIFGFWENESQKASLAGLPPYITYEMLEAALDAQDEYGHPAGCTIAQIIVESGKGDTMSLLATRDHNLFGMKWASSYAATPEVSGKANWITGEEVNGLNVSTTATFTVFKSDADCIKFRSRVFLANSRYAGNSLIREAIAEHSSDKMAEGLKDAGWATDSAYVDKLKSVMDTYNLRTLDSMSASDLAGAASGTGSAAIIAAAKSQLGVPYVWGGTTPGVGLDCSGLTQYCYAQAGISIPRNSEAQANAGTKLPLSMAQPGDILWRRGHVAIYIGNDQYIHEPYTGEVCKISSGISYFTCAVRF